MTNLRFLRVFARTSAHEGGYVNDPDDLGRETYRGISRRWHPEWPGWILVDDMMGRNDFPKCLDERASLQGLVREFYRTEFWDKVHGDDIESEAVAAELFDTAVNMAPKDAVTILQRCLNALNKWVMPDLKIDGIIGPETVAFLSGYLEHGSEEALLIGMNSEQGHHYIERGLTKKSQRRFVKGWLLKRVGG
ncbi:MAG: hypothetical protein IIA59_00505 [Candidatus Marinimicrobia bacterium]|nr:hypothetical protein [Candidatus Neomarinimicrobiota bacterium]